MFQNLYLLVFKVDVFKMLSKIVGIEKKGKTKYQLPITSCPFLANLKSPPSVGTQVLGLSLGLFRHRRLDRRRAGGPGCGGVNLPYPP